MHRLLCIWIRRRSATRPQADHGLAGICVPATLMGFHRPSQCCACPRRSGCLHPGIPTCRLPPRSPRPQCLFLPRDRPATPCRNRPANRDRAARLLGFLTADNPCRIDALSFPAETALGFVLLQGFGTDPPRPARRRASAANRADPRSNRASTTGAGRF